MEKTTKTNSVFHTLSSIDCRDKTEKKNGLTYLSWAWACMYLSLFAALQ